MAKKVFKKALFGYDTKQVDQHVQALTEQNQAILPLRERVEELREENESLRLLVKKYQDDEQAISKSLVESQKIADELRGDAKQFAEITLSRAKIFYATWTAYSKTLVASLSAEELKQFNQLKRKIEQVINAFEGKNVAEFGEKIATASADETAVSADAVATSTTDAKAETVGASLQNPLDKISQESGQVIDLRELLCPEESLAELCQDLGLPVKKDVL